MNGFELQADYKPKGDQPEAIETLVRSIERGNRYQTLLGVTGSGKTFTMANVIQQTQRPTLIMSHNKTLAAQLYSEFQHFFPNNAVEYFVSFYDYYQPEAYIPASDTYIEKDTSINDEIDRLRIAATSSLLSRSDVIVIASVSCIYGLGSPEDFEEMMIPIRVGDQIDREFLLEQLVEGLYERNDVQPSRGRFRVRGEVIDIFPSYLKYAIRVELWGDEVERIRKLDPVSGELGESLLAFHLYPAKQYITPENKRTKAIETIRRELEEQLTLLENDERLIEAQRLRMRCEYDLEMLQELGYCNGIENYSRHLSGRQQGERPFCLIDFFPKDFLLMLDESHVTWPQIGGMYHGDRSRKERLVEHGFRLPSALDNRPLQQDEFTEITGQTVFVSATPGTYELDQSSIVAEQVIRPTGLVDPPMEVRPIEGQVEDIIEEIHKATLAQERTLVTTLTKRMSEDLTTFLRNRNMRVEYLHSDIDALERVEIIRNLRQGEFDVLVGVNLLREGLDLPEVALVGILDADKEGFLRSETSLIQTAGRAARHEKGRVLLYADVMTRSIKNALSKIEKRRVKQLAYNKEHNITPRSVRRSVQASLHYRDHSESSEDDKVLQVAEDKDTAAVIAQLESEMLEASDKLEFERAAHLRDQIDILQGKKAAKGKDKKSGNQFKYRQKRYS